jgi:phosphatidylinositol dimannoside acyltransferase
MDLVTPAYRAAAAAAQRLPRAVVEGSVPRLAAWWSLRPSARRRMVESHQRRVRPQLDRAALRRQVAGVYRSYGRYWAESFRLPAVSDDELDARLTVDGYEHIESALAAGLGPITVLPHLGSWEWCAYWLARIQGITVTAVVERLEPPALFEWFQDFRRHIGINVVPLGPGAGREVTRALKDRHLVALLSDRDITGGGVPVDFFGEKTTLPAGPATLALRTGAALLPVGVYDRSGGCHHAIVRPPLSSRRQGSLREDVARVTQDIAIALEELIREAPEQWHLLQPNWPTDRDPSS